MMNEFYEELYGENVFTYRLSDGSYVVADELDLDEDTGAIYVADPLELIRSASGECKLRPWVILDEENVVEINSSNIISRSSTAKVIKSCYLKFISAERLLKQIHKLNEEGNLDQDNYDGLDKLDSSDDFFNKLEIPSKSRWNWKDN